MDFNKVIIASDSTSDLNKELIEKYDIKVIPMTITLGKDQYTDGVDVDSDKIYEYYNQTKQLPKTSAVNAYQFSEVFEKYIKDGYSIVCFTISSEMSSTFNNARLAASEFENVHIVDTRNLSTGGGLLVLKACELREQGKTAAEIANACRELTDYVDASFVIDNLEFLHKGGRCNAVTVFAANLLKMKPCIMVKGGKMGVGKKYRGSFEMSLKKYIQDQLEELDNIDLDNVFVTHAGCDESIVNMCVDKVKELAPFKNLHITRAGCTVSSHCGRNTLGVLFIRKNKLV